MMRKTYKKTWDIEDVVFVEVPEAPTKALAETGSETVLDKPRWAKLPKLPRFQDEAQKKAFGNIIKFVALVLIFTLIARGTTGATLAKVDTVTPYSGEIMVSVSATGTALAASSCPIVIPSGLTLAEVLIVPGQSVKAGDVIARLDAEEVAEGRSRAQITLDEMNLKLQRLEREEPYDGGALINAQNALAWAEQDYANIKAAGEVAVATAQMALSDAQTTLAQLKEGDAEVAEISAAEAAVTATLTALDNAIWDTDTALQGATRAIETAKVNLAAAQLSDNTARQVAADATTQNALDAEALRLDIAEQQAVIDAYDVLENATIIAPADGVVLEVLGSGTVADENSIALISNTSGGYMALGEITETDAGKLAGGVLVNVSVSHGYYSSTTPSLGTVISLSTPNSEGNVQITVKLPVGEWTHGQSVNLEAVISRQLYQSCVPISALGQGQDGYFVYVMEESSGVLGTENVVRKVPVTLIARDNTVAAIEGGVLTDDHVISGTSKPLADGDKVRVRQP